MFSSKRNLRPGRLELGLLKLMTERVMSYVGIFNFMMILYLYVKESPLRIEPLHWVVFILLSVPLLMIFDWKLVYPSVLSISYGKKNKEFQDLRKDIRILNKKMDELNERIDRMSNMQIKEP